MGNEIETLQKIIDESDNIVFFGGAGDDLKPYVFYAQT